MGREGRFHADRMKEYGTKVVGGTKPGAGGTFIDGIPMFDTVASAVEETGANASIVFVPAPAAMDALLEAIDAQIELVIAITEGIPVADMLKVAAVLETAATTLVGPKGPGAITPGRSAPPGKRMGHAGAIVSGTQGTAESKVRGFEEAGIPVASAPSDIPRLLKEVLHH